jgi:hypothetical protein
LQWKVLVAGITEIQDNIWSEEDDCVGHLNLLDEYIPHEIMERFVDLGICFLDPYNVRRRLVRTNSWAPLRGWHPGSTRRNKPLQSHSGRTPCGMMREWITYYDQDHQRG